MTKSPKTKSPRSDHETRVTEDHHQSLRLWLRMLACTNLIEAYVRSQLRLNFQTTREAQPIYGRMYQTPFSDRIRNEVGIATIAVGNIFEADHVNSIVAAGRADLCAIARPHLADPAWTLHAAAQITYPEAAWPKQYLTGKAQLERNLARAAQLAIRA